MTSIYSTPNVGPVSNDIMNWLNNPEAKVEDAIKPRDHSNTVPAKNEATEVLDNT